MAEVSGIGIVVSSLTGRWRALFSRRVAAMGGPSCSTSLHRADANPVSEWIADPEVDAVVLLGNLIGEIDASSPQAIELGTSIIGRQGEPAARSALRDQRSDLFCRGFIHRRRARAFQKNLPCPVPHRRW